MDRALQSLLREMAGARERRSLNEMPYEDDTDLSWVTPAGPSLPYDGDVPQDVQQLASDRRQQYDA